MRTLKQQLDDMNSDSLSLYKLVHDLRQPLRTMMTSAQMADPKQIDDCQMLIDKVIDAARWQDRLLSAVVEFEGAAEPIPQPLPMPIKLVVSTAFQAVEPVRLLQKGKVQIEVDDNLCCVASDAVKVIQKLLLNSLVFHDKHKEPKVVLQSMVVDGFVDFVVRDEGIGIDAQFHEKVFLPLTRLYPISEYPGSGLGLATSRRWAKRLQGQVQLLESSPGSGTVMQFRAPRLAAV
jgi:signal transduction histidine kinase